MKPLSPDILSDALQDRIHKTSGKLLDSKPIRKNKSKRLEYADKSSLDEVINGLPQSSLRLSRKEIKEMASNIMDAIKLQK